MWKEAVNKNGIACQETSWVYTYINSFGISCEYDIRVRKYAKNIHISVRPDLWRPQDKFIWVGKIPKYGGNFKHLVSMAYAYIEHQENQIVDESEIEFVERKFHIVKNQTLHDLQNDVFRKELDERIF